MLAGLSHTSSAMSKLPSLWKHYPTLVQLLQYRCHFHPSDIGYHGSHQTYTSLPSLLQVALENQKSLLRDVLVSDDVQSLFS